MDAAQERGEAEHVIGRYGDAAYAKAVKFHGSLEEIVGAIGFGQLAK